MTPRNQSRAPEQGATGPQGPQRTCIGCRRQASRSVLVRLVVSGGNVVIDQSQSMPGRGAYVHPASDCMATALDRRAVGRALRNADADASGLTPSTIEESG